MLGLFGSQETWDKIIATLSIGFVLAFLCVFFEFKATLRLFRVCCNIFIAFAT
jgi:hypothetical protein